MNIKHVAIAGMGALGMLYGTFLIDAGEKNITSAQYPNRLYKALMNYDTISISA